MKSVSSGPPVSTLAGCEWEPPVAVYNVFSSVTCWAMIDIELHLVFFGQQESLRQHTVPSCEQSEPPRPHKSALLQAQAASAVPQIKPLRTSAGAVFFICNFPLHEQKGQSASHTETQTDTHHRDVYSPVRGFLHSQSTICWTPEHVCSSLWGGASVFCHLVWFNLGSEYCSVWVPSSRKLCTNGKRLYRLVATGHVKLWLPRQPSCIVPYFSCKLLL